MKEQYDYITVLNITKNLEKILEEKKFNDNNTSILFNNLNTLNLVWDGPVARNFINYAFSLYHYINEAKDYENRQLMLNLEELVNRLKKHLLLMEKNITDSNAFLNIPTQEAITINNQQVIQTVRENIGCNLTENEVWHFLHLLTQGIDESEGKIKLEQIYNIFCEGARRKLQESEFFQMLANISLQQIKNHEQIQTNFYTLPPKDCIKEQNQQKEIKTYFSSDITLGEFESFHKEEDTGIRNLARKDWDKLFRGDNNFSNPHNVPLPTINKVGSSIKK